MTLHVISVVFFLLAYSTCNAQTIELPADEKTTACFKTHSSIKPTSKRIPFLKIQKGNSIVFDYIRDKGNDKGIWEKDTIVNSDTDFFERITFAVNSNADSFYFSGDSLKYVNGYYEFHGGESSPANTDFRIRKGFIKANKVNGNWIVEASIAVVDKQKVDSIIQKIKFKEIFKNCD